MRLGFGKLILKLRCLLAAEEGQDLVEYALIAGLIATACVASSSGFARLLLTACTSLTSTFDSYV
jgi:Flp pilus assembly pilin Flp